MRTLLQILWERHAQVHLLPPDRTSACPQVRVLATRTSSGSTPRHPASRKAMPLPQRTILTYPSRLLHECVHALVPSEEERMVLVGGVVERPGVLVATTVLPVEYQASSRSGVHALPSSSHEQLCDLEQWGMRLCGVFHSHPGTGVFSTQPSSTDLRAQAGYEACGHHALTGIVSQDRTVRFVTCQLRAIIRVLGKGCEEVSYRVIRLCQ